MKNIPNQREVVLLAILLHGEKYGRQIRDNYETRTRHSMPLGSLYTTLERMEKKGFVRSRMGESNPERGGNRRKYFRLTGEGTKAFNDARNSMAVPNGVVVNA
jgi:PadR family transcriptional regulator, regulatory protein PadR